jgi:hypothetical protein
MSTSADAELDLFRQTVNCAAVLERMMDGWKLDVRESTKRTLKYRRGPGEIIIVNHDGHGWWDATGSAKGDVFNLVQHLDPNLNFGQVRQVLRRFVGVTPSYPEAVREKKGRGANRPVAERWAHRPRLRHGSEAWTYLTGQRALTRHVVEAAAAQDAVREGPYGSVWFAHRLHENVSHVEIRGPAYKGSLTGGHKTLFRFRCDLGTVRRLTIAEAPIDGLSLAVLEDMRADTLYVATGGGMGPGTINALIEILGQLAAIPDALVSSAADANTAGDRYAARHAELTANAGVPFARLRPPEGLDWNDVLQRARGP